MNDWPVPQNSGDSRSKVFATIEAAEVEAGFAIPHPRGLTDWHLASVRLRRPAFGKGDFDPNEFYFAVLTYISEPPGRSFNVTCYRSEGPLTGIHDEGEVEIEIAGRPTLLHTDRSFHATTIVDGVQVALSGFLHPPGSNALTPPRRFESLEDLIGYAAKLPQLDVDDVIRILEAIR